MSDRKLRSSGKDHTKNSLMFLSPGPKPSVLVGIAVAVGFLCSKVHWIEVVVQVCVEGFLQFIRFIL